METIEVRSHVGPDGVLRFELPTSVRDKEVEVVVESLPAEVDALGWPTGFFDRTYGALADDPIERPPQPPLETRD